jgi:hypothetical protein
MDNDDLEKGENNVTEPAGARQYQVKSSTLTHQAKVPRCGRASKQHWDTATLPKTPPQTHSTLCICLFDNHWLLEGTVAGEGFFSARISCLFLVAPGADERQIQVPRAGSFSGGGIRGIRQDSCGRSQVTVMNRRQGHSWEKNHIELTYLTCWAERADGENSRKRNTLTEAGSRRPCRWTHTINDGELDALMKIISLYQCNCCQ